MCYCVTLFGCYLKPVSAALNTAVATPLVPEIYTPRYMCLYIWVFTQKHTPLNPLDKPVYDSGYLLGTALLLTVVFDFWSLIGGLELPHKNLKKGRKQS